MDAVAAVRQRFAALDPVIDERTRRLLVAAESSALGPGGISIVSQATGVSRQVIRQGLRELKEAPVAPAGRIRRVGGGRKRSKEKDLHPSLPTWSDSWSPLTRGDPESSLRWTCKSVRNLSDELKRQGHKISYPVVAELLHELGYSLQSNRKTKESSTHPDRNQQFEYINARVERAISGKQPVISVDTTKKELVGDFKNSGSDWRPKGQPEKVRMHDFAIPELGRVAPCGVYDLAANSGWVSVGLDHDTASFAVETIRRWWHAMGQEKYPEAKQLIITADGGGSNGSRLRLWKLELQKLADETGLIIAVSHFPPGKSKWNKIEHRLFSFISKNWRGQPLTSLEVIVSLIAATTTRKGLKVHAAIDDSTCPAGARVSDSAMKEINLRRDPFHGEWNYGIRLRGDNVIC